MTQSCSHFRCPNAIDAYACGDYNRQGRRGLSQIDLSSQFGLAITSPPPPISEVNFMGEEVKIEVRKSWHEIEARKAWRGQGIA
jgi:hypothetical protein